MAQQCKSKTHKIYLAKGIDFIKPCIFSLSKSRGQKTFRKCVSEPWFGDLDEVTLIWQRWFKVMEMAANTKYSSFLRSA